MPNQNGTGPNGEGPRTGRGQGNCRPKRAKSNNPAGEQSFGRNGRGKGKGLGRGLGRGNQ